MSLKGIKKLEENIIELEIEVLADEFEVALEKSYKKNVGKMNVQGFRRGKAPRKIVERMFGEGVFFEDAVNLLYPQAYEKAIEEEKIEPVDKADIEIIKVEKEGFTFKAKVTVKPEVELGTYKGIKVDKVITNISDEEIDVELENVKNKYVRLVSVSDRPSQIGDVTIIDYEGFIDGVVFEGGKGENHSLKLGSNQFIPGFEEQLVGKNIGDNVEVNVTFPEEYKSEELKGKSAIFKVKINEIKFNEFPIFDDEFAKDISEFDTFEEYKNSLRTTLLEQKEKRNDTETEGKIIEILIKDMKVNIPEVMVEKQLDNFVSDYEQKLRSQGLDLATYLSYTKSDIESFRKMFKPQAESQVKTRLALEKITELEKIIISQEEIDEEYKKIAEMYKMELDKIKTYIPLIEISKDIAVQKAIALVKNSAIITMAEEKKIDNIQTVADKSKKTTNKKTTTKKATEKTTAKE